MQLKVFSKRHKEAGREVALTQQVRQRIWFVFEDCDPYYEQNGFNNWTLCYDAISDRLKKEHGWQELRAYKSQHDWEILQNTKEFILKGVPRFILDATELFFDLISDVSMSGRTSPSEYQKKINVIFEDANMPWRLLEGRIIKVDSKWLETEILAKAAELLSIRGFDGALAEFQQARSDLLNGDCKGTMHSANLALESTIKAILGIQQEKPGALIRKLIDSGLVPEYHEGFLKAFEEHILRSVPMARNLEKGVGHGQGTDVSEPPKSLAELAINLSGVLILYLLKRHMESHPIQEKAKETESEINDDEVPF